MGRLTYLVFELTWSLPVILLQWAVGRRRLWSRGRSLLLATGLTTIYLSVADGVALANGIWTIHADRIVGLRLVNVPLEEVIFFAVTDLLVVQSVLLVASWRRDLLSGMA